MHDQITVLFYYRVLTYTINVFYPGRLAPMFFKLFPDGGHYHIKTSPLICSANQWTGFYMITTSVMKELNKTQITVKIPT